MVNNSITYVEVNKSNYKEVGIEDFLWKIRNDPQSRIFSVNDSYIQYKGHKIWFHEKIDSQKSIIFICSIDNIKIGVVRFEKIKNKIYEISIILSPDFRNYKLSDKLLSGAINKFNSENKENELLARIHNRNKSSQKIFLKLGFAKTTKHSSTKNFENYILDYKKTFITEPLDTTIINKDKNVVGIMQPTFLPWLGYFALMEKVDYFVLLDDVQLSKQSWQVRNRIRTSGAEKLWLTLPVKKHDLNTNLNEIKISDDKRLINKILNSFKHHYSKSPFFDEAFDLIEKNIHKDTLTEITSGIIEDVKFCAGISTQVFKSSELEIQSTSRDQRLVDIINYFECKHYISPVGSGNYLELEETKHLFNENKIEIEYLHFEHPKYPQNGKSFISQMGIVDSIANIGYQNLLDLIKSSTLQSTKTPKL
jgi:RimJ/RimL family protein N-acetyltransferase